MRSVVFSAVIFSYSMQRFLFLLFAVGLSVVMTRPAHATTKTRVADPVNIEIPALNVQAKIEARGTTAAGVMLPPTSAWSVAWHVHGTRPGERGSAVMYGHLNTHTSRTAIFTELHRLAPGNTIRVTDAKNVTRVFKVKKVGRYPRTALPVKEMTGRSSVVRLNVYTCDGVWIRRLGDYSHRFVVFSELVSTSAASQ